MKEDIFPKQIKLKDIKGSFLLISSHVMDLDYDDFFECYLSSNYIANYLNEETHTQIVMIENRMIDEPIEPVPYILNTIDILAYSRMAFEIKKANQLKIIISHDYGSTARIIIIKDLYGEGTIINQDLMEYLVEQADIDDYKWHIISGGKVYRLDNWGIILNGKYK